MASLQCLPAEPKRLEGLDYKLAILDAIGVIGRDSINNVLADLCNLRADSP